MRSVEIIHLPGCASSDLARRRVEEALELLGRHDVAVQLKQVGPEEAMAAGSPSLVLEGRDLFTTAEVAAGRACRVYVHSTGGAEGVPELGAVLEALRSGLASSADLVGTGSGKAQRS